MIDISGCVISGYSIGTVGNYYIQVTDSSNIQLSVTGSFTVSSTPQKIFMSATNTSPSANFDVLISATVQDNCDEVVVGTYTISLTGSIPINGTLSVVSTTGFGTFSIYCLQSGTNVITATTGAVSGNITLNVLQDLLKITTITPTVCLM